MGTYRFILALLVLISHAGVSIGDYNPGVMAVISFYLLSGYVMTILINKYYPGTINMRYIYLGNFERCQE